MAPSGTRLALFEGLPRHFLLVWGNALFFPPHAHPLIHCSQLPRMGRKCRGRGTQAPASDSGGEARSCQLGKSRSDDFIYLLTKRNVCLFAAAGRGVAKQLRRRLPFTSLCWQLAPTVHPTSLHCLEPPPSHHLLTATNPSLDGLHSFVTSFPGSPPSISAGTDSETYTNGALQLVPCSKWSKAHLPFTHSCWEWMRGSLSHSRSQPGVPRRTVVRIKSTAMYSTPTFLYKVPDKWVRGG